MVLTRASFCLGDDVEFPHEVTLDVPDEVSIEAFLRHVRIIDYLPQIGFGNVNWTMRTDRDLAIVDQRGHCDLLVPTGTRLASSGVTSIDVFFEYHSKLLPGWSDRYPPPVRRFANLLRRKGGR